MAGALCLTPDPTDAANEPCILSEGHGGEVPHLWSGQPCRHFRTTGEPERCVLCGLTLPTCKHCGRRVTTPEADGTRRHLPRSPGAPPLPECQHPDVSPGHLAETTGEPCRSEEPPCLGSIETPCPHLVPEPE